MLAWERAAVCNGRKKAATANDLYSGCAYQPFTPDRNLTCKMFASAEDPETEKGNLRSRTSEYAACVSLSYKASQASNKWASSIDVIMRHHHIPYVNFGIEAPSPRNHVEFPRVYVVSEPAYPAVVWVLVWTLLGRVLTSPAVGLVSPSKTVRFGLAPFVLRVLS